VLTTDEKERVDEKPRGMFYYSPAVGTKYTYQNPKLGHVRVDVAKVGSRTLHVGFEDGLC